jgi:hypothetical protein
VRVDTQQLPFVKRSSTMHSWNSSVYSNMCYNLLNKTSSQRYSTHDRNRIECGIPDVLLPYMTGITVGAVHLPAPRVTELTVAVSMPHVSAVNSTVSLPCSEFNRSSSTANLV